MRVVLFLVCAAAFSVFADPAADAAAIRVKILKGADAAMRADAAGIMSHYAKDILLSYPGIADQNYDTLLEGYSEQRPEGMTLRTAPSFDEVLISGDLAVLRLNWTTTLTFTDPPRETTRQARDVQVWRRERDGEWMFVRGMHFRNAQAVATSGADKLIVIPAGGANNGESAIREAILRSRVAAADAVVIRPGVVDEAIDQLPILEVLVSGGLGVVRLGPKGETKELQIWTRAAPGAWKLAFAMRTR